MERGRTCHSGSLVSFIEGVLGLRGSENQALPIRACVSVRDVRTGYILRRKRRTEPAEPRRQWAERINARGESVRPRPAWPVSLNLEPGTRLRGKTGTAVRQRTTAA